MSRREYLRQWKKDNKPKVRASNVAYRKTHRAKVNAAARRYTASHRSEIRLRRLVKRYGREIEAVLAAWDGTCAICRKQTYPFVDHDHTTGRIRGILCHVHNVALGLFNDDCVLMRNAIRYLEKQKRS